MCNNVILVIAASGRMLAQSARRGGLAPLVIDIFGDRDTRELALAVQNVDALTEASLAGAIDAFSAHYNIAMAVYGSGLETHPAGLDYLFGRLPVYGNTPAVCRRIHDKREFFAVLGRLAIRYPDTRFTPPETAAGWLLKPYRGEGGRAICAYAAGTSTCEVYWQRLQPGEAMSALFLADTQRAQVIGFNRQWSVAMDGQPFIFSGVMSDARLPAAEKRKLTGWLQAISAEFSLAGLNSLDFIWDGRQSWALEINPRPSASMAVYDDAYTGGLLAAHLAACRGKMPVLSMSAQSHSAYQIVYAPGDCRIPAAMKWPVWALDRPGSHSLIRAGDPICSIMARAVAPQRVVDLLRARQQFIINSIQID